MTKVDGLVSYSVVLVASIIKYLLLLSSNFLSSGEYPNDSSLMKTWRWCYGKLGSNLEISVVLIELSGR